MALQKLGGTFWSWILGGVAWSFFVAWVSYEAIKAGREAWYEEGWRGAAGEVMIGGIMVSVGVIAARACFENAGRKKSGDDMVDLG